MDIYQHRSTNEARSLTIENIRALQAATLKKAKFITLFAYITMCFQYKCMHSHARGLSIERFQLESSWLIMKLRHSYIMLTFVAGNF